MMNSKNSIRELQNVANRIFNAPLVITQEKLDVIIDVYNNTRTSKFELDTTERDRISKNTGVSVQEVDGIAVVGISGTLVRKTGALDAVSGLCSYEGIQGMLSDLFDDEEIKGILLSIDSPGGEACGCFELVDYIREKKNKPIYAHTAGLATSGAYALASSADKIFATKTSVVGSVGVIVAHVDKSEKYASEGIKVTLLRAGDDKALINQVEPLDEKRRAKITEQLSVYYGLFTNSVASNRGMSVENVVATQANTYMGVEAVGINFIDGIATFGQVLKNLKSVVDGSEGGGGVFAGTSFINGSMEKNMTKTKIDSETNSVEEVIVDKPAIANEAPKVDGRKEAIEIVQLCALAGCPAKATEFLLGGFSAEDVRGKLLAEAAGEVKGDVNGSNPGTVDTSVDSDCVVKAAQKLAENMKATKEESYA